VTVGLLVYFGQKNNREKGLFYSGTIETTQGEFVFPGSGRVVKVNVQEGQSVAKNQIIAELDRREFESRYDQAKSKPGSGAENKAATGNSAGYRQENAALGSGQSKSGRE